MKSIISLTQEYILNKNLSSLEFTNKKQSEQADVMSESVSFLASSEISKGLVCIRKTSDYDRSLSKYVSKDFYCITDSHETLRHLNVFRNVKTKLSNVFFSKKDRTHIYSIARQLTENGLNPDDLYIFIYFSEGSKGLRFNTIHINYLNSLASF